MACRPWLGHLYLTTSASPQTRCSPWKRSRERACGVIRSPMRRHVRSGTRDAPRNALGGPRSERGDRHVRHTERQRPRTIEATPQRRALDRRSLCAPGCRQPVSSVPSPRDLRRCFGGWPHSPVRVAVVPVYETEAWLLVDEASIRVAATVARMAGPALDCPASATLSEPATRRRFFGAHSPTQVRNRGAGSNRKEVLFNERRRVLLHSV